MGAHSVDCHKQLPPNLSYIPIPTAVLNCQVPLCDDVTHCKAINGYASDITKACLTSAKAAIPSMREFPEIATMFPVEQFAEPSRAKSVLWHNIWVQFGRSRTGIVAVIMRRTRSDYHCNLRHFKHHAEDMSIKQFADAMLSNNDRNFWSEVRNITRHKALQSNVVDRTFTT